MATLTPFSKTNTVLPQASKPRAIASGDNSWVQPPPPAIVNQPVVTGDPAGPWVTSTQAPMMSTTPRVTGGPGFSNTTATNGQTANPYLTSAQGNISQGGYAPVLDEGALLNNYLGQFLGADSALMRDARTRGIEAAANAGLQNSSLSAGASQRAALDVAVPLAQQAFGLFGDRENRQWSTTERLGSQQFQSAEERAQRDWTADQNRLDRDQQITMSQVQNWLNNETFMREFNANLALLPVTNTTQLLNTIMQQAVENPEVYTPDIISGLSEFFTTNFLDVLSRYFPSMYAQTGGAS